MKLMANTAKGLMLAAFMAVGVTSVGAQTEANEWWRGENIENTTEAYIYNVGAQIFITDNTPSIKDIAEASVWTIENNKFTSDKYHINLWSIANWGATWYAEVSTGNPTTFTIIAGTTQDKGYAYKLSKKDGKNTRYFNVDGNKYTAAKTKESAWNDWLFISPAQKEAYDNYVALYNEANDLLNNEKLTYEEALKADLKSALEKTANSNYSNYNDDVTTLNNAITPAKEFVKNVTSGLHCIHTISADQAKSATIYNINGVRSSQLNKGINIIKMSDGTVKKVLVK